MWLEISADSEICRSGLTVITTASPRNFEFVKSLGADHVFDYVSLLNRPRNSSSRLTPITARPRSRRQDQRPDK